MLSAWWASLGTASQIILLSLIAGGCAKVWLFIVEIYKARQTAEQSEETRILELDNRNRTDMLQRIARLEAEADAMKKTNSQQQSEINKLERDMGILLGIVNQFRLCQQPDCPTMASLRNNGSLDWLDQQVRIRSNGRGV